MTACLLALALILGAPRIGSAQTAADRLVSRIEIGGGGGFLRGSPLGATDANLRASDPVRRPYRLFSTGSRFASAPTFHVRAGVAFNRRVGVEGGLMMSRPELRTSTSADIEEAPPLTVAERVDQYVVDAGLIVLLNELRLGSRTVPFVAGGGGYLRQLHQGLTLIEQGQIYHAGAGIKHWLVTRDQGFVRGGGVRADARVYLAVGGISFEDRPRSQLAISGSAFVSF